MNQTSNQAEKFGSYTGKELEKEQYKHHNTPWGRVLWGVRMLQSRLFLAETLDEEFNSVEIERIIGGGITIHFTKPTNPKEAEK